MLLLTLGSLSGTGCLIAEAPSYAEPRRTAPVIDDSSVSPLPSYFIPIKKEKVPVTFSMTVTSEDAGESLLGVLVVDYAASDGRELWLNVCAQVAPRAADQPKQLSCNFIPDSRLEKGCHSLTLFVGHESSFSLVNTVKPTDDSDDDLDSVTWFMEVEYGDNEPWKCPTQ